MSLCLNVNIVFNLVPFQLKCVLFKDSILNAINNVVDLYSSRVIMCTISLYTPLDKGMRKNIHIFSRQVQKLKNNYCLFR